MLGPVYRGDTAAFDANKPEAILHKNPGAYSGHVAIFSVGGADAKYLEANRQSVAVARAAGFDATLSIVPGAGHLGNGLVDGMGEWFNTLYLFWGLSRG